MKPERSETTKRLSSGKYVDLATFSAKDVDIFDITQSLNYIFRFTGHYKDKPPLTVAQHTKLVMKIAEILFPRDLITKFDCLIHDMAESITSDVATPIKKVLGETYMKYEESIESAVYEKLWTIKEPFTTEIYNKRKICDLVSLDIERRSMWANQSGKARWPDIPFEDFVSFSEKKDLFDWAQEERFVSLDIMYEDLIKEINNKT